jgi:cytochrome P450
MTYINQIMKETSRINGPVTRVESRTAIEDTVLPSGTFVPKGTKITINFFNIHHTEIYWKDADKFDPDRLLKIVRVSVGLGKSGHGYTLVMAHDNASA